MTADRPILPGIKLISLRTFEDERGFFMESYQEKTFKAQHGIDCHFVQDNFSHSKQDVLRGLHYQILQPQAKLVRVISGVVFDVCVDLRKSSPTFGQWMGITLDAKDHQALWIPEGFAHGFLTLSSEADFFYKTTNFYCPEGERCLLWNDPQVNIDWPLEKKPVVSLKDQSGATFKELDYFA